MGEGGFGQARFVFRGPPGGVAYFCSRFQKPPPLRALGQFIRFLKFYWYAETKFTVHSPFVFEFLVNVLEDRRPFYAYGQVEGLRRTLLEDRSVVELEELGAGSRVSKKKRRTVRRLVESSCVSPEWGRFLFRLVHHYKPRTLLELGTCLGVSTLYQASAAPESIIVTLEGQEELARRAEQVLQRLPHERLHILTGAFDDRLDQALDILGRLDYLYVDGNHRYDATLRYFERALNYAHEHSVFVFDDIHWSGEMEQAWKDICRHPRVRLSLDLFRMGVVFFRPEIKVKTHFNLVPWYWKPWKMGFLSAAGSTPPV